MNLFMSGSLERKRSARRLALLKAASALFSARGFDAVSVSEIAEAADLATGTFYNYFPTKTALLLEILSADIEAMLAEMQRSESADDGPSAALIGLGLEIFRVVDRRSRALWRQVIGQAMLDPEGLGRAYAALDLRLKAVFETTLARFQNPVSLEGDQKVLLDVAFNLGNALFYEYILDEAVTVEDVQKRFLAQIGLVLRRSGRTPA